MANERKQKKKSGGWWWLIFVAIALISKAAENGNFRRFWMRMGNGSFRRLWLQFRLLLLRNGIRVDPALLLAAALVIVLVVVSAGRAAAKRRAEETDRRPASARTSAAVQRKDPRSKSFERPEPYCLVCDHTGEDHFQHDKVQRIRQLEEWLKNGLIDREEYKVLKARFERDL